MKDLTLLVDEFMEACNCEATIDETAYHFYELGYKECREQMMKEAVEGRVVDAGLFATYNTPVEYTHSGDKVKIIIVKED